MNPPPAQAQAAPGRVIGGDGRNALFRLQICHDFYNSNGGRCTDIGLEPTPDCAALMQSIGLLLQRFDDGLAVHVPEDRRAALAAVMAADPGARLDFLMICRNPDFIGFTALPINTCPTTHAIHCSNLQGSGDGPWLALGAGTTISGRDVLPASGPTLRMTAPMAGTVTARDQLGRPVTSINVKAGEMATLSLSGLAYGRYAITAEPPGAWTGPPAIAYMPASPLAIGLVELLLAPPAGHAAGAGAFPAISPSGVTPACLTLAFTSRTTYWNYYIVAGQGGTLSDDLAIAGANDGAAGPPVRFTKEQQRLPNGDVAIVFAAQDALPLQQAANARFSLAGRRSSPGGKENRVAISRLPAAPKAPVWPAADNASAGVSEIFVYV